VLNDPLPLELLVYLRLIIGILSLCTFAHLTVLSLSNAALNLTFSLLPITSSHPHASASDSTFDFWRCVNIWLTLTLNGVWLVCWQRELDGDVTLCCAGLTGRPPVPLKCGGAAGICQNLYDSAPSGRYGTMSYLCRSVVQCLSMPTAADGNLDCVIQWSLAKNLWWARNNREHIFTE